MSKLKDPYDIIEWSPNRNRSVSPGSGCGGERRWGRMHPGSAEGQWIGQIYNLISLCTLAVALAAFVCLLLNR
jgi:hypothetical protein